MAQVQTMRGPIDVDDMGPTLMHEHVYVLTPEYVANYGEGDWWDEDDQVANAIEKLSALATKGIRTIVDPTVIGLGRYIPRLKRIADQVDLNIIVASGVYTYGDLPWPYANRGPGTLLGGDEPMVADFVGDLTEGITNTGVIAAFLKCAVEHAEMSPGVERALRGLREGVDRDRSADHGPHQPGRADRHDRTRRPGRGGSRSDQGGGRPLGRQQRCRPPQVAGRHRRDPRDGSLRHRRRTTPPRTASTPSWRCASRATPTGWC